MLSDEKENYDTYLHQKPYRDDKMHIVGYKVYADGALGSRGAYLLDAYSDKHNHYGYLLTPIDSMQSIAQKVYQTNYQLCTHAIGDKANREVLKIYALAYKEKYHHPADEIGLYFVENNIYAKRKPDEKLYQKAMSDITKVKEGIVSENFIPKPDKFNCPFNKICPASLA